MADQTNSTAPAALSDDALNDVAGGAIIRVVKKSEFYSPAGNVFSLENNAVEYDAAAPADIADGTGITAMKHKS